MTTVTDSLARLHGALADRYRVERELGDDDGAVAAFEQLEDGPRYERIYISHSLAVLGAEFGARPRVQAARQRFVERLRVRG